MKCMGNILYEIKQNNKKISSEIPQRRSSQRRRPRPRCSCSTFSLRECIFWEVEWCIQTNTIEWKSEKQIDNKCREKPYKIHLEYGVCIIFESFFFRCQFLFVCVCYFLSYSVRQQSPIILFELCAFFSAV